MPGSWKIDSATDGWPSSVQDWSYCCEPSSTRATSRRRTMRSTAGGGDAGGRRARLAVGAGRPLVPPLAAVTRPLGADWTVGLPSRP